MIRSKEEILAEYIATDILRVLNSPSELRFHFGTAQDVQAYVLHHEDYYRKLNNILDELINELEIE